MRLCCIDMPLDALGTLTSLVNLRLNLQTKIKEKRRQLMYTSYNRITRNNTTLICPILSEDGGVSAPVVSKNYSIWVIYVIICGFYTFLMPLLDSFK